MAVTAVARRSVYGMHQQASRDRQASRGGKGKQFSLRLKLGASARKVHLQRPEKPYKSVCIEGEADYWYHGLCHFVKTGKFVNGRGFECNIKDCLICAHSDPETYGFKGVPASSTLSKFEAKPYYGVSGWVEHNYHLVEKEKDKKPEKGQKATYTVREICEGRNCKMCKKGLPTVFGNRFFYDFSTAAWADAILPAEEEISRRTKDGGYIWPVYFGCEKCGYEFFDMTQRCYKCESDNVGIDADNNMAVCSDCDAEWTLLVFQDEGLLAKVSERLVCPKKKCKHEGYPVPKYEHSEGLDEWESYDIYDVQLTLKKTGTGTQSRTVVSKWEIQEPDPRLFDPDEQGGGESGAAFAKRHAEALDLAIIHAADIPAVVATQLEVANLFAGEAGRASKKSFKKFNRKKDEDDEDSADEDEDEDADVDEDEADDEDEDSISTF